MNGFRRKKGIGSGIEVRRLIAVKVKERREGLGEYEVACTVCTAFPVLAESPMSDHFDRMYCVYCIPRFLPCLRRVVLCTAIPLFGRPFFFWDTFSGCTAFS